MAQDVPPGAYYPPSFSYPYNFEEICKTCGMRYGNHHDLKCRIEGWTFKPLGVDVRETVMCMRHPGIKTLPTAECPFCTLDNKEGS